VDSGSDFRLFQQRKKRDLVQTLALAYINPSLFTVAAISSPPSLSAAARDSVRERQLHGRLRKATDGRGCVKTWVNFDLGGHPTPPWYERIEYNAI
jgi:hypothetical protein